MRQKYMWWLLGILALVLFGAALLGPIVSNVEQPKYTLIERSGSIEVRDYAPMIVAETEVKGKRREAISKGFRVIADYIFGINAASRKVAMTAPVIQQSGERIAMTAPLTQQGDGNSWLVRFVMPSKYTIDTLPKPNNPAVDLKQIPTTRYAAIRFSGMGSQSSLRRHTDQLNDFLSANKLTPLSTPTYAFYNPPWTLPFLRRNEVLVKVAGAP